MQGIREFNRKIQSLKNTGKITGSMKMISSVKLQRFTKLHTAAAPYFESIETIRRRVCGAFADAGHVLISGYEKPSRTLVLLVTSDRGLCGQYNANAVMEAMRLYEQLAALGRICSFACAGGRGYAFLHKRGIPAQRVLEKTAAAAVSTFDGHAALADSLLESYLGAAVHEIWAVYTRRISPLLEKPVSEMLLPMSSAGLNPGRPTEKVDYLLEQRADTLVLSAARLYLRAAIHRILVESALSEHAARMAAMESASENCDRMINRYMKVRNRARQASITTELSEIVTGKEALEQ